MRATAMTLRADERTADERQGLETLVRRHSTPQQVATRARIVRAAAEGRALVQIARAVGLSRDSVRLWRDRWVALQDIPLADLSVAQRLAAAPGGTGPHHGGAGLPGGGAGLCGAGRLGASHQPVDQPGDQGIAAEIMRRGIVGMISPRHAARLVKRGTSNPI